MYSGQCQFAPGFKDSRLPATCAIFTKYRKGFLVLVAEDASENTRKKFRDMCDFYEVPVYVFGDKEELGKYCGKEFRASLAVQDENFAKAIMKELEKSQT